MAVRRALSCLLVVGLTVPALAAAQPALADSPVSGIIVDTGYSDGLGLNGDSSLLSPTYEATASLVGAVTTFRTRQVSTGSYSGPQVSVSPPSGAATLAPGHYETAATASDVLAGLVVKQGQTCSGGAEGTLDVAAVTYGSGLITSLAAAWSYRCVGSPAWAFGEVRFAATTGVTSGTQTRFLSLGSVGVGSTTAAKSSVLRNNGTVPLLLGSAHLTGANPGDFTISSDACSGQTLPVGATCSVGVTSTPTSTGNREAELQLPDGSARGYRHTQVLSAGLALPSAPLSVVAEPATDGTYVSWRPPTDDGGSTVTSYQVLRGTTSGDLAPVGTTSGVGYGDPLGAGTLAATTYYYAVKAITTAGTGPASTTVSSMTPAAVVTPPSTKVLSVGVEAPSAPYAQSGRVLVAGAAGTMILVSTNFPGAQFTSSIPSGSISTESVYLNPPSGGRLAVGTFALGGTGHGAGLTTPEGTSCSFSAGTVTVTALTRSSSGALAIADADLSGTCGGAAAFAQVRIGTNRGYDGSSVTGVDLGAVAVGQTSTGTSTLTNTGSRTLHVTSVDAGGDWTVTGPNTCSASDVAPGASCSVTLAVTPAGTGTRLSAVAFHDDNGTTTQRRDVTATGTSAPTSPAYLTAYRASSKVTLSWNDPGEAWQRATSFEVLRGTSESDADVIGTVASAGLGSTTFQDPDTSDGARWYGVRGSNVAGTGSLTSLTVDVGLRAPVVTGAAGASLVGLQWLPSPSLPNDTVTGYRVYRGTTAAALTAVADVAPSGAYSDTPQVWSGPAPASGAHVFLAVAPLVGSTVGPRSPVLDLIGTSVQLITASSLSIISDGNGGFHGIAPSAPLRLHTTAGATIADLKDATPTSPPYRYEVAVNPRGAQVAYLQSNGGQLSSNELWYRNIDGSGSPVKLMEASFPKSGLSWSPDGTKIAFGQTDTAGGNGFLYTITTAKTLVKIPGSDLLAWPSWIDSSTLVARDMSGPTGGLVRLNVTTGARTLVAGTAGALEPAASADGKEVAYQLAVGPDHVEVLRVITLSTGVVRALPVPDNSFFSRPSWTRDGKRIYVTDGSAILDVASDGSAMATRTPTKDEGIWSVAVSKLDTAAPSGTKLAGIPSYTLGTSVTPTFSATDVGSGVGSYALTYRKAAYNGSFGPSATLTLTASRAIAVAKGYTYCFSVRATDKVFNTSAATAEQCTVVPMDDRSLVRSSRFAAVTGSVYYASTGARSTTKGATLTRTGVTSAKQLFLVVTTCKACGTLDVLVGSTRIKGINLYSATTVYRKVIALPTFTTRSGTVTLKVTSTGKTVILDGLGVRK